MDYTKIEIPPLDPANPKQWFVQLEVQFNEYKITEDDVKYHFVLVYMEPRYAKTIIELILLTKTKLTYEMLKNTVIFKLETHTNTEHFIHQNLKLLEVDKREEFLTDCTSSIGSSVSKNLLRDVWIDEPADNTREIATQKAVNVNKSEKKKKRKKKVKKQIRASEKEFLSAIDNDYLETSVETKPCMIRQQMQTLNINNSRDQKHLNQTKNSKKLNKQKSQKLNVNKRNSWYEICSALLLRNKYDPFLDYIIICEKWPIDCEVLVAKFDENSTLIWQEERIILYEIIVWWSRTELIHYTILNKNKSIMKKYHQEIDKIHVKLQPTLINQRGPILLHDNDQLQVPHKTMRKLYKLGYEVLPYLSYCKDGLPFNYLFKHFKAHTKPQFSQMTVEAVMTDFVDFLKSKTPTFYATGIDEIVSHWKQCVD